MNDRMAGPKWNCIHITNKKKLYTNSNVFYTRKCVCILLKLFKVVRMLVCSNKQKSNIHYGFAYCTYEHAHTVHKILYL